jgi:hypothetical protein
MAREPAPKCVVRNLASTPAKSSLLIETASLSAVDPESTDAPKPSKPEPPTDALQQRERERDCFREAEGRVRNKLTRLQTSVQATLKAVEEYNSSASR